LQRRAVYCDQYGALTFDYVTISTRDTAGFYIDTLYFDEEVPEPIPGFLTGGGLFLLALASRKLIARG
jgi:hypothetical protein